MKNSGLFYDGENARPQAVFWSLDAQALRIEGDQISRSEAVATLHANTRLAQLRRIIYLPDGSQLHSKHHDVLDQVFPRQKMERWVDRLERHPTAVAGSVLLTLVAAVSFFFVGLPYLADRVAQIIPPEVESAIGAQVMKLLGPMGLSKTKLDEDVQDRYQTLFAEFVDKLPKGEPLRLEFRAMGEDLPNALAIPGGSIIFTDGLIDGLGSDEEFLAVLAHEIGHQRERHVLRSVLQQSAVIVVVAFLTGDVSAASGLAIGIPTFLLSSHYSRDFETEADNFAFEQLRQHGYSPEWFAIALARIERNASGEEPIADDGQTLDYASTHPSSAERLAAARQAGAGMPSLLEEFLERSQLAEADSNWPDMVSVSAEQLHGCWAGVYEDAESEFSYGYTTKYYSGGKYEVHFTGISHENKEMESWDEYHLGSWRLSNGVIAKHVKSTSSDADEFYPADGFSRYRVELFDGQTMQYRVLTEEDTVYTAAREPCK